MSASPLTIVMTGPTAPGLLDEVRAAAPGAEVRHHDSQAEFEADLAVADVAATVRLSPAALASAGRLRWVQSWAAGPDALLFPEMLASPVVLTCARGNGAVPLAEHAMMLILMLDRDVRRALAAQAVRRWDRFPHGELAGRTLGILGTGHAGQALAVRARAFGMRVIGLRRGDAPVAGFDALYRPAALHAFLGACDFLVVTAPLTPETEGMLDAAAFAALKPGAVYVCISRGGIASDEALLAALADGRVAAAGLDAHSIEPLPPDSPFWGLPNVIITPHHGAVTAGTRRRGVEIFLDNLGRFLRGEPLRNLVDKAAGY
ncbi:MAG: D-2-hydroxyacid dehydrogenase [Rhodobacteraceae bacterium]|jgi:phosphoglycerate dehydrogenase-like enzyme|nr:D-2-hydroxyacid dehydrogenase [Paracoccaceae bacterium]